MEPVPSTSSVGKRPATPPTESSSKRTKQDIEDFPLYWICSDRKVTCQAIYYGGLALIRFRRKGLDYDGNVMDRAVFVTKDELTSLETELPRAIEIMNNLSTQRNLPNKRHMMALLSPQDSHRMRYIDISVFKKAVTCSVRVFYFKDGLLCPRKEGVTFKLKDLPRLQRLLPMLLEDLDKADHLMRQDRLKEDETDRLIREFEQRQGTASVAKVRPSIAPTPGPTPGWSGGQPSASQVTTVDLNDAQLISSDEDGF